MYAYLALINMASLSLLALYSLVKVLLCHNNMGIVETTARSVLSISATCAIALIDSDHPVTKLNMSIMLLSLAILAVRSTIANRKLLFSRFHIFR